jgi:hypothetical protein
MAKCLAAYFTGPSCGHFRSVQPRRDPKHVTQLRALRFWKLEDAGLRSRPNLMR